MKKVIISALILSLIIALTSVTFILAQEKKSEESEISGIVVLGGLKLKKRSRSRGSRKAI